MGTQKNIATFFTIGVNYKKTDAAIRGMFAVGSDQYVQILLSARAIGIEDLFVLSTCNRTEVYGLAENADQLITLLCNNTRGGAVMFEQFSYIKTDVQAVRHLFEVAAGLDSQILGDYEIVGQIKQAVKFSKERGCIGGFLERLVNSVLQSSKSVKNNTAISAGTVSVSFAAIQYIRQQSPSIKGKRILLVGTGKIGRNTCKNMVDYLGTQDITLINRTAEKAAELAAELGLRHAGLENLDEEVRRADIILVATNAQQPAITKRQLQHCGNKLVIDLSIPYNVEKEAHALAGITYVNVDDLSKLKDETIQKREAEIPKVKQIIDTHLDEFITWQKMRRHVPVLKALKFKLQEMQNCALFTSTISQQLPYAPLPVSEEHIQRVVNVMAVKMRQQDQYGCHYIEAINDYIACGSN